MLLLYNMQLTANCQPGMSIKERKAIDGVSIKCVLKVISWVTPNEIELVKKDMFTAWFSQQKNNDLRCAGVWFLCKCLLDVSMCI